MPAQSMSDLLTDLTGQVVETQKLNDAQFLADWDGFEALVAATPAVQREHLRPLAPQRMLVHSFDLSLSLSVAVERDIEFRLQAFPINLNYSKRHSLTSENQSRMTFSVVQRPLAVSTLK
jgi:hypothetical protein